MGIKMLIYYRVLTQPASQGTVTNVTVEVSVRCCTHAEIR